MVIGWLTVPETLYSVEEKTPSDQRETPTRVVGIGQRVAPPCTGSYVRRGMWDEDLGARRAVCFNETLYTSDLYEVQVPDDRLGSHAPDHMESQAGC
ncbi:uncharacterized protein N7498_005811 [Penicillium cinerascens]|uniref:Uncharacterized protein n=1 Tax=Penicillium cinerascens TaxID=70096 RepID=A0A9W9T0J8_9EURO|nr:uncharacterized protein N7498_005811 [Penicillium cinerascens]KAJ5204932.1 hypothetical protein N7498_005811 [Penicillium cinerascens]